MIHLRKSRVLAILALAVMLLLTVSPFAVAADIDLTDADVASEYLDSYSDNVGSDPDFGENLAKALETKRADIPAYSTWLSLLPPIIAIALALITKEVYSSLFIGITAGALMYANFNFSGTIDHLFVNGFISSIADSYNIGILIFLVVLGTIVSLMNKSGGSAAFGRWASTHIKSRFGAQLATIALGILIFVDDYFNCLTVGSVMRPVSDKFKVSRSKLAYLIDATAAPICIIAPISSWAAAVAGFVSEDQIGGLELFIRAIPYNFYAILTIVMMLALVAMKFDYGPMKKHEDNAANGDLYSCRKKLSEFFGADNPSRVIFTKNCTEALNIAIQGGITGGRVLTSALEHNSTLRPLYTMEKNGLILLTVIEPENNRFIQFYVISTTCQFNSSKLYIMLAILRTLG